MREYESTSMMEWFKGDIKGMLYTSLGVVDGRVFGRDRG